MTQDHMKSIKVGNHMNSIHSNRIRVDAHELATETSRIVDAVRQELPEAPLDFDDGDTSLPAQLARVGGLVDDIVDASALTPR